MQNYITNATISQKKIHQKYIHMITTYFHSSLLLGESSRWLQKCTHKIDRKNQWRITNMFHKTYSIHICLKIINQQNWIVYKISSWQLNCLLLPELRLLMMPWHSVVFRCQKHKFETWRQKSSHIIYRQHWTGYLETSQVTQESLVCTRQRNKLSSSVISCAPHPE